MAIIGMLLMVVGGIASFVCGIWLLIEAFKTSIIWGLCYLFVPFAALVFVVMNWEKAKKPFLYGLGAAAVMVLGMIVMAIGAPSATAMLVF
ncbi:hypothetical protein ACFL1X_06145 [Candidatus Hydrogenedentota bacterium]